MIRPSRHAPNSNRYLTHDDSACSLLRHRLQKGNRYLTDDGPACSLPRHQHENGNLYRTSGDLSFAVSWSKERGCGRQRWGTRISPRSKDHSPPKQGLLLAKQRMNGHEKNRSEITTSTRHHASLTQGMDQTTKGLSPREDRARRAKGPEMILAAKPPAKTIRHFKSQTNVDRNLCQGEANRVAGCIRSEFMLATPRPPVGFSSGCWLRCERTVSTV